MKTFFGLLVIIGVFCFFMSQQSPVNDSEQSYQANTADSASCPYPDAIFQNQALENAVTNLLRSWDGNPIYVRQAYRPKWYQDHIRTIWKYFRLARGQNPRDFRDYGCDYESYGDLIAWSQINRSEQMRLRQEFRAHSFHGNSFPIACDSDHTSGIAVDLDYFEVPVYDRGRFIAWANHYGLVQNIPGDDAHFVLTRYFSY